MVLRDDYQINCTRRLEGYGEVIIRYNISNGLICFIKWENVILKIVINFVDLSLFIFTLFSSIILKILRRIGLEKLPLSKLILLKVGVLPVRNHYYEPQFVYTPAELIELDKRNLVGINLNIEAQLSLLKNFKDLKLPEELNANSFGFDLKLLNSNNPCFKFNNGSFESGDAEVYYNMVRTLRPKTIIEIGSGNSTLVALQAIDKNISESSVSCDIYCIEPYEMPWLEMTNAKVIRSKVENLNLSIFDKLIQNDILFIDSSHIIRPGGDVLFNFLTVLPSLNKGVYVHIHDIFTPRNYLKSWIVDKCLLWNEQYLLEAFLTNNDSFAIVCATNFLHHNFRDEFKTIAPFVDDNREPGSFWIQKIK